MTSFNNNKLRNEWVKLYKVSRNRGNIRNVSNNFLVKQSKKKTMKGINRNVKRLKNRFKKLNSLKNNRPNRTVKELTKIYLKLKKQYSDPYYYNPQREKFWLKRKSKKQLENNVLSLELKDKRKSRKK